MVILLLHFIDYVPFLQVIDLVVKFIIAIQMMMIIMIAILILEGVGVYHHPMKEGEYYDLLLVINDDKEVQVGVIADSTTTILLEPILTIILLSNNHGCPIEEIVVLADTREEGGRVCQLDS